mmetsp:Transcript_147255/g.271685  ORF Transcript_147255/g.271685 Transcript_147255/m.271685 type:complete len:123 (+) Transcript_147255:222-590(+)
MHKQNAELSKSKNKTVPRPLKRMMMMLISLGFACSKLCHAQDSHKQSSRWQAPVFEDIEQRRGRSCANAGKSEQDSSNYPRELVSPFNFFNPLAKSLTAGPQVEGCYSAGQCVTKGQLRRQD